MLFSSTAAPWSRGTSVSLMRGTFLSRSRSGSRSGSIYAALSEPPGGDMYIYAWRGAERRSGGGDSLWPLGSLVSCWQAAPIEEPDAPGGRRGGDWLTWLDVRLSALGLTQTRQIPRAAGESAGLTPNRSPALYAVPAPCRPKRGARRGTVENAQYRDSAIRRIVSLASSQRTISA
jgi:hypothetical protein